MAVIESRDYTLGELFEYFYVVRAYQREYVWEEKEVLELLMDVHQPFIENKSGTDWEYFIGSIIVCKSQDLYELIDGQQRMTTAYLVLCAFRDFIKQLKPTESLVKLQGLITSYFLDRDGDERFKDRIELQYDEDSRQILEKIARNECLNEISENNSVRRLKNTYQISLKFFKDEFGEDESAIQEVKQFYARFLKNIKLVRVETQSRSHALKVFETINNRGVGLDATDLLKNLMFMNVDNKDFERLKNKWKKMLQILFDAKEKPIRFLRYFIISQYDSERIREDGIYEWFDKNRDKCKYADKPFEFIELLLKSAEAFANFKKGNDTSGKQNRYLRNISYLSTSQHFVLLLAAKNLSVDMFTYICKEIENFMFVYIITRTRSSKLENLFVEWASQLRKITKKEELDEFIQEIQLEKQKLADNFVQAFQKLDESSVQKKVLQYILAKLTQSVDEVAYGNEEAQSHIYLKNYINKNVDIEHILPKSYEKLKLSFDQPDDIQNYVKRLGNLLLVEKAINTSIKNKPFELKKDAYCKSKFLLTRSIIESINIGRNTSIDRAVKNLMRFEKWDSKSIENRQYMLTELAKKVWGIT